MEKAYLGAEIPKLGFGMMRLPMNGEEIDLEQVKKMADRFIAEGFTYFDTAWGYLGGRSEGIARKAVVERYPREKFQLATKFPIWAVNSLEDRERIFQTQLERTGAGYFDFYLVHAVMANRLETIEKFKIWDFMKEVKARGLVKHIGFSYHDSAEVLDKILDAHPEVEFVQLQINYADWEDSNVQSRACYEACVRHGKSVVIMEPVKGGSLAALPESARAVFKAADPDASCAAWAIRYAASLDGLVTVLSGMSDIDQMEDNLKTMKNFKKLSEAEAATVQKVLGILQSVPLIPCTGCRYCTEQCPQKIDIPSHLENANNFRKFANLDGAKKRYQAILKESASPAECLQCGLCEGRCPQHISIIEELQTIVKTFGE